MRKAPQDYWWQSRWVYNWNSPKHEKETRRIIGGQIVGGEEVTQRVNALSFAIQKQMTVFELAKADTCYAPPLNETWEPMVLAAEIAIRRLK